DLRRAAIGQCLYAPLVDEHGGLVNDPIAIKLDHQRYWLSIADSDVLLWAKGLAYGTGLDVTLRAIKARGVSRKIVGLKIAADSLPACVEPWPVSREGRPIGEVTSAAVSPQLGCGVALAMLGHGHWQDKHAVVVETPAGPSQASVCPVPFLKSGK